MNDLTVIDNEPNTERQTPIEKALQIDADGNTTSKALYDYLELNPSNYAKWCKNNIEDNPYAVLDEDYWVFVPQEENPQGGRPSVNYKLTADLAKKLAMASGSPKGEAARDYFISVEQNAKKLANSADSITQLIMNDPIMAMRYQQIEMEQRLVQVEEKTNEVEVQAATAQEQAALAHKRINELDAIDPNGTPRQQLIKLVNRYSEKNGLLYAAGWRKFREAYNIAYHTNIRTLSNNHMKRHGIKNMTIPEYLEQVGRIDDGLRVAQKMLKPAREFSVI